MPRQLNPAETQEFMYEAQSLPKEDLADVALKWRERCVNVLTAFNPSAAGVAGQVGAGGAWGGAMGWWDAKNHLEQQALIEAWQTTVAPSLGIDTGQYPTPFQTIVDANGAVVHQATKNPRAWLGVNKTAYLTAGLGLAAGALSYFDRGTMAAPYLTAGAMSGVGYVVGTAVHDAVLRNSATPAVVVSNPSRRRRAA
jgi:hypothetical protein